MWPSQLLHLPLAHTATLLQRSLSRPWRSSIPPVGQRPNSEAKSVHKPLGNAWRPPEIVSELNTLRQQGIYQSGKAGSYYREFSNRTLKLWEGWKFPENNGLKHDVVQLRRFSRQMFWPTIRQNPNSTPKIAKLNESTSIQKNYSFHKKTLRRSPSVNKSSNIRRKLFSLSFFGKKTHRKVSIENIVQ